MVFIRKIFIYWVFEDNACLGQKPNAPIFLKSKFIYQIVFFKYYISRKTFNFTISGFITLQLNAKNIISIIFEIILYHRNIILYFLEIYFQRLKNKFFTFFIFLLGRYPRSKKLPHLFFTMSIYPIIMCCFNEYIYFMS